MFASHRGTMGSSRFATIVGQRGMPLSTAHGLAARHGSAEQGTRTRGISLRADRSRGRDTVQLSTVRSGPAGPQERVEWMDALRDCQDRITTLKNNRGLGQKAGEHHRSLEGVTNEIVAYKEWVGDIFSIILHPFLINTRHL